MTNTSMTTGGSGAANAAALLADVAAGPVDLPAGTYNTDEVNFPSNSTIEINWQPGAKLRPAKTLLSVPLLGGFNCTTVLNNPAGNQQFDCRNIAEQCLKFVGGTFDAENLDITNLGRPTYSGPGTYGLLLSGVARANVAGIKVRNVFALANGVLGDQSGLARAFATFNCDDVTITDLDLADLLDSDDGDYFQIQDTRTSGIGTVLIDGGAIVVNEKTRRWGKQLGGNLTVRNLTISRKPGFVAYDGTTMIGEKNLHGFDMVDGAKGSCLLEYIEDNSKAFKIAVCKSAAGAAPITVKDCLLTGTTMNAHNSFINSDGTSAPTIGIWNAGGPGVATHIGGGVSGFDTNVLGTWV